MSLPTTIVALLIIDGGGLQSSSLHTSRDTASESSADVSCDQSQWAVCDVTVTIDEHVTVRRSGSVRLYCLCIHCTEERLCSGGVSWAKH